MSETYPKINSKEDKKTEKTDSLKTLNSSYSNVYVKSIDSRTPNPSNQPAIATPTGSAPSFPVSGQPPPPISQTQSHMSGPVNYSSMAAPSAPIKGGQKVMAKTTELGPVPANTYCPYCHHQIVTITKAKPGRMLYTAIAGCCCLCLLCCECCLGFIPACIEEFYDIEHICRNCGRSLGIYFRA